MNSSNVPTHQQSSNQQFIAGCIACVPTVLGYLAIGFSAGALARVSGMSGMEVALMSLILYAGSAQFIVAGMASSHAATSSILVAVFFINLRHLLMSAYLVPWLKHIGTLKSFILGMQLTDETFGVASVQAQNKGHLTFAWMLGLNLTAYLNWLIGNMAGALLIALFPYNLIDSLQFALVSMFVGLIVLQIFSAKNRLIQIIAAVMSVALFKPVSFIFGNDFSVVMTALITSFITIGVLRWKCDTKS